MSKQIPDDQIEIIQDFIQESRDMIDRLEPSIIRLGQSCVEGEGDPEIINAIFRLFHSMKGSAGFLDLTHIASVAHAAENLLDLIRGGKIGMTPAHVDLLCQSCDFAKEALEQVARDFDDGAMGSEAAAVSERLMAAAAASLAGSASEPAPAEEAAEPALRFDVDSELMERFVQDAGELLQNAEQGLVAWTEAPDDSDLLAGLSRDVHSFKGNCGLFGFAPLERLSHQMESVLEVARFRDAPDKTATAEHLLTLIDILRDAIADVARGGKGEIPQLPQHLSALQQLLREAGVQIGGGDSPSLIGELLRAEGVPAADIEAALEAQRKPVGEILVGMGKATPAQVQTALQKQEARKATLSSSTPSPPERGEGKSAVAERRDIRVDLTKLDRLIDLIGEMVIAENMLIHSSDVELLDLERVGRAAQQISKLVRELQEVAMIIRMVPVSGLFRRMIRLVHDLSVKSGKKVELILVGEETEMDKTVIETITDPLVHLVRNALDHGLEPPEERRIAGKGEKGTIRLSARHEEGEVWIDIEDDGRGLNREKILAKAISKGLIEGDGADLSDRAVANLIFHPGFSTADQITEISGRGVGMDVVKRNIEAIKGKIELHSVPGEGSRIVLRIPLTLGIIDGMMVRVGGARCIVPTLSIREAFRPVAETLTVIPGGQEIVRVRESFFPITRLHEILKKEPDSRDLADGILIVLEHNETGIALLVDEILGQQQTVIKGLSSLIGNVRWASGCTILGDGEVCLILDVGALVEAAEGAIDSAVRRLPAPAAPNLGNGGRWAVS